MSVHVIRLQGHWTPTPLPDGRTRFVRRFGHPRTLDATERMWAVSGTVTGTVSVNDVVLGTADAGFAFDLTPLLKPRNELTIDTPATAPPTDVVLEIRS